MRSCTEVSISNYVTHSSGEASQRWHYDRVMSNLNTKVGFTNTSPDCVMMGRGYETFCIFHRLAIGGTLFEPSACHNVRWTLTERQRKSEQFDQGAISSRFRSCFLNVRNKRTNEFIDDRNPFDGAVRDDNSRMFCAVDKVQRPLNHDFESYNIRWSSISWRTYWQSP